VTDVRGRRPDPVRWIWYALGGGLPPRYREWVLHDLTTRSWFARHLFRAVVQMALPGIVLIAVLPVPLWVRLVGVLGGVLVGIPYAVAYAYESTEHRATKAGFPPGTSARVRSEGFAGERAAAAARYAERYRSPDPGPDRPGERPPGS
jgi:hypothetical protein